MTMTDPMDVLGKWLFEVVGFRHLGLLAIAVPFLMGWVWLKIRDRRIQRDWASEQRYQRQVESAAARLARE